MVAKTSLSRTTIGVVALVLGLTATLAAGAAAPRTFLIDVQHSRSLIQVGKSGAFSFLAGHTHEVEAPLSGGVVHLDPADPAGADVRLQFDAAAMRVTGKGEPPDDVPKVQEVMLGKRVLDVEHYPTITFESTGVSARRATPTALDLTIAGKMTIHGVTQPVTAPVSVTLDGGTLTATGTFTIKQSDYGIRPISVVGVVNVKDTLTMTFTIIAKERAAALSGAGRPD